MITKSYSPAGRPRSLKSWHFVISDLQGLGRWRVARCELHARRGNDPETGWLRPGIDHYVQYVAVSPELETEEAARRWAAEQGIQISE